MKTLKTLFSLTLILSIFLFSNETEAQRKDSKRDNRTTKVDRVGNDRVSKNHVPGRRYRTQPIRRNPHYRYPRHRRVVRTLPVNYRRYVYAGLPYYFHAGIFYTSYGNQYVVVLPPRGFRIAVLPVGYRRIVIGVRTYFYFGGVYYIHIEGGSNEEKYEVVEPPVGAIVTDLSDEAEKVVIDGKVLYDYNGVLYKEIVADGEVAYKVVYSKSSEEEENK